MMDEQMDDHTHGDDMGGGAAAPATCAVCGHQHTKEDGTCEVCGCTVK